MPESSDERDKTRKNQWDQAEKQSRRIVWIGCGLILLFLFIVFVCGTCTSVDWTQLSF